MLEFNLVNCVVLPTVEAIFAFKFLPHVFPAANTLATYLVLFAFINISGLVLYKLVLYPFFLSPLRHLPKVKGFRPLIGHGWMMMVRPSGEPHLQAMKAQPDAPLLLARGFFHAAWLFPTTPEALADVLVHKSYDYEKPVHTRNFLSRFIGFGLLMAEGEEHKHSRKNIMPAFSFRNIKDLYGVFWDKSIEFRDAVRGAVDAEPDKIVDLCRYTTQVTLDIIGLAGLGRDIGSLRNSEDELVKNFEEILQPTSEKAFFLVLHVIFPGWFIRKLPWSLNKRVDITTGNLRRITTEFVREKKANMKVQGPENQPSRDILSIMIRSNNFSDINLVDQLLTFLAAG
ncbi:CypX Cytochrome P450 [Pyrenophora tritici-repentis]|nr:Cytochrome P450 3A4 [Pyrenophora tritici-repentis]KAF7449665.1 Cytochrome P450 3A4 [Pyrenophora tritici-repentis]KAG9383407.1 Cytochrome P450 3A4 [Pyrenophora tritici-repentis]KAI1522325.1 CypX Cytochrome P450 [Pyrenophora tritici-repentis]KAI1522515.1 CypX Cytochrome P450 [Pyrenophora tritici-repentis]